jgi:quercetin dioxygenase-like cupin family protein
MQSRRECTTELQEGNMIQYRKFLIASSIGVMAAAALAGTPAQATPAIGFVGTQLAKGLYGPMSLRAATRGWFFNMVTQGTSDVYVVQNAIAVGGQSGWHTHPGPSLVTVTVGEIVVYDPSKPFCGRQVYRAGDGSVDVGSGHLHLIRNESAAAAVTVAVQFVQTGAPRRIDAARPLNCP